MTERRGLDKVAKWLLRAEKDERIVPAMSHEVTGEITACHDYIYIMEVRVDVLLAEVRDLKHDIEKLDLVIYDLEHPEEVELRESC